MALDPRDRLAFALDVDSIDEAAMWIERLRDFAGVFKIGLELFTATGPTAISMVHDAGCACFLDLKLHDIPATMAKAVGVASRYGVRYLTVHAAAGPTALAAAAEASGDTQLLAVTVLTSLDRDELSAIGIEAPPKDAALHLTRVATEVGIHGFVASAQECGTLRASVPEEATIVVPGIRPAGSAADDQRRVATPQSAITSGADILVVGRPIRHADDPRATASEIVEEIRSARAR